MIKNKYFIASIDEIKKIGEKKLIDTVKTKIVGREFSHVRQNLIGDKVVLKYPVDMKPEDMTLEDKDNVKYITYTHEEILVLMATDEWTNKEIT